MKVEEARNIKDPNSNPSPMFFISQGLKVSFVTKLTTLRRIVEKERTKVVMFIL